MLTNIQYAYVRIFFGNHVKGMCVGSSAYTVFQMSTYVYCQGVYIVFMREEWWRKNCSRFDSVSVCM